jgi:ubiquinone biosynthesis protein
MRNIKQTYRNAKRATDIVTVLAKYGFGYVLDIAALSNFLKIREKLLSKKEGEEKKIKRLTTPERARLTLEELGPTFIKLGQILSVRPDLIPREFTDEFSRLQDTVPPFPFGEVEEQIKNEIGKDIKGLFSGFDKKPIAAASLSQVHKAKLKSGETVAVKIQRPNIHNTIKTDIAILYDLT